MILADTSIWIDHFRNNNEKLVDALLAERVTCHPFIIAEIALGSLRNRSAVLGLLDDLPSLPVVLPGEVRVMIETRRLFSCGIGYVDASLLASCLVVPDATLWTHDWSLAEIASELGISESPA